LFFGFILSNSLANTFTVTNTNDSGNGSLRDAISQANSTPGSSHIIEFNILQSDAGYNATDGVWVVQPLSPLPYITRSGLTLDGTTQTAHQGNTNIYGPEIMLSGNDNTVDYGFFIFASNVTVRGFIVSDFNYGIQIYGANSQNNVIAGNYVGTNASATDSLGNDIGIEMFSGTHHNRVGGSVKADRNVVSGNRHIGIRAVNSSFNNICGNFVGTNRTGTAAVGNYDGISIEGLAKHNMIGGTTAGLRNIVSGNVAYGIPLFGAGTDSNTVYGNYIGTDTGGTHAIPNTYGVLFDDGSKGNIVGGLNPGERNILSGNSGYGVFIYNMGTTNNFIIGNYIGTDPSGTTAVHNGIGIVIDGSSTAHTIESNVISGNLQSGIAIHITLTNFHIIKKNKIGTDVSGTLPLPNGEDGIRIGEGPQYNVIGDTLGGGNIIAFNGMNGVNIMDINDDHNRISGNSIFNNASIGIDLFPPGVTINDAGDGDDGPNDNMNFPKIDTVIYNSGSGQTTISGTLDTPFPELATIELFKAAVNHSGYGEGKIFLKTIHPDNFGNWSATLNGLSSGDYLTTTATDSSGNTSEFSTSWSAQGPAGIQRLTDNSAIYTIYPNPFAGYFEIKTAHIDSAPIEIYLYDMEGKMMDEFSMNSTEYRYNSEFLKAGVYKVLIKQSGKIQAVKLVVKR
jgi:hypothetical protein